MVNQRCSVQKCPTRAKDKITFYCFPKNPKKNVLWVAFCGRPSEEEFVPNAASRLCARHFKVDDFMPNRDPRGRRRLKDGVVPSLRLPAKGQACTDVNVVCEGEFATVGSPAVGEFPVVENVNAVGVDADVAMVKVEDPLAGEAAADDDYIQDVFKKKPKITKQELERLPEDQEVDGSTISSADKSYYLSLARDCAQYCEGEEQRLKIENFAANEKVAVLAKQLDEAYKKNATLVKKNKSLRLQLYAANKKPLSLKAKQEVAKEVLKPFFTKAQIDCFCRPCWFRSRNWAGEDFEIAIALRKLMSKKAFSYLRKKRLVPMPSLTSLRKHTKINGIVLQHNTTARHGSSSSRKVSNGKKSSGRADAGAKKAAKQRVRGSKKAEANEQQPQALLYEQISGSDSANPHYIVVESSHDSTMSQPQYVTLGGDVIQHVGGSNVEFIQTTTDEATGQVFATILSNEESETVQMVKIDEACLTQGAYTILPTTDQ